MFIKNIILCIYIIFYIQYGNAYEEGQLLSKDDVLKITDELNIDFYCKNDTCSFSSHIDLVKFPDENGNIKDYIHNTCNQNMDNCSGTKCTKDTQCLSNKCVDNYCRFNDESPIIHCEDIPSYNVFQNSYNSYIHCGKIYRDTCKNDDECSFLTCEKGMCGRELFKYSDNLSSIYVIVPILILHKSITSTSLDRRTSQIS
ncbi:hypothetical protein PIROE2DRAFT_10758 [Piromyces sp. E2]|nr:hypothetical protein PIROE2DRAFT_10758 [Piromyces sp. E2]|eukprot:OUM62837.1 hypothetical protein PIROE2DRAFT_10758 [Piromyces sp. E2]